MSLVRFSARNHPQQAARDDVDDRRTPRDLFDPLHARHAFTVDAAASAENALLSRFWTRDDDALSRSWAGERVWCNPPYSNIGPFVAKAFAESACPLVVLLLPANRCEQSWWQDFIEPARHSLSAVSVVRTDFLKGRLRFGYPEGTPTPRGGFRPPFGCVLVTIERAL